MRQHLRDLVILLAVFGGIPFQVMTDSPAYASPTNPPLRLTGGTQIGAVDTSVYVTAYGAKGDGTTDDTTAIQNAINAATGNSRRVYFPGGEYKVTSTLQINTQGIRFIGGREGRPGTSSANEGATRIDYTGTGPCIQLGTDNGHAHDAADYNGVQGFSLENISLMYTGASSSNLLNGQGTYGTGTYGVQDWRGGDVHFDNVRIEHFQYGFWGIQSDIDYFEKVEILYCSVGIYAGPRSDQMKIERYYNFYDDTGLWVDAARNVTVSDSQFVDDGDLSAAYPVKIGSAWSFGAEGINFENTWFESAGMAVAASPLNAFVDIGDGDTQTSTDIRFKNTTVETNTQGTTPYAVYFARIDHADNVVVDGTGLFFVNFSKPFQFAGSGNASVLLRTKAGDGFSTSPSINSGTGTPVVNTELFDSTGHTIVGNLVQNGSGYIQTGTGGLFMNGIFYVQAAGGIIPAASGQILIGYSNTTHIDLGAAGVPTNIKGSLSLTQSLSPSTPALATQTGAVYQGSGAPSNSNGNNGDVYFRTDTPGTANQRVYIKSAGSWTGIL